MTEVKTRSSTQFHSKVAVSGVRASASSSASQAMNVQSLTPAVGNYPVANKFPLQWAQPSLVAIQSAAMLFSPIPSMQGTPTSPNSEAPPPPSYPPITLPSDGLDLKPGKPCSSGRKRGITDLCEVDAASPEPPGMEDGTTANPALSAGGRGSMATEPKLQTLKWMAYQRDTWAVLCTAALEELVPPTFVVEADKGFNFSHVDDSFVCQKKNHFQVSVTASVSKQPKFLRINNDLKLIKYYALHLYGIKLESENTVITLEQSAVDRSKKAFLPHKMNLPTENPFQLTIGRLHFSHTTENNMRKKGRPNPDQKFFSLVVAVHAYTSEEESYPIVEHVSERIIVRASNPSNFEIDCDSLWVKGQENDSVYYCGRVGINVDLPPEALSVSGNIHLTGQLLQPSDERLKRSIAQVDPSAQLHSIRNLQLYNYQYQHSAAKRMCCDPVERHIGFIAQQVREVLPDAVKEVESTLLEAVDAKSPGQLLTVDKDRIFTECVGAVQHLDRIVTSLDQRLANMEQFLYNTNLNGVLQKSF